MDDDQFVMWRAVLEGIGYDYMALADTYRKAGVDLNRLTVTEGGSRNPLWNQIKSNMLNANVVRFKNAGGAVLTNCIVASFAVGDTKDIREALSANITQDAQYAPDEKLSHRYRQLFEMRNHLVRDDMKVGDTKDIREALSANITQDAQYAPDEKLSHRYRQLFEMRNHLVRDDMKVAFHRLVEMRNVD